jgi:hypothetical protein
MKLNWFKALSFLVVATMLLGTGATAFAESRKNRSESKEGLTAKVWIYGAKPGDVISAYQFAFSPDAALDHNGTTPEGSLLESQTPVPFNGQLEFFVPTLMPSVVYAWNESQGYRYLGQVAPSDSEAQISINAAGK